jgi:hypothetical protein
MGALEDVLPEELKRNVLFRSGDELVLLYAQALQAVAIATENNIAILGVDAFEVRKDGLWTVNMDDASGRIDFTGDWTAYVAKMNSEADRWIRENPLGENFGYIITSASESEFARLDNIR